MPTDASTTRTRAARLPAEERRRQILDAAIIVFARLGFAGTGTADIAREAGIGEPTIYRYFTNKRDLYLAAIREGAREIREHWEEIRRQNASDPMAALQQIGIWYYGQMQQRPELLVLRSRSFSESPDGEALALVRDEFRSIVRFVQSLFDDARANGQLAADADTRTMTWLFMAVGALLDVSQVLDLSEDLRPDDLVKLASMLRSNTPE
jgi:AcrR family transcriptional regulator